jgi:hypothetical protein
MHAIHTRLLETKEPLPARRSPFGAQLSRREALRFRYETSQGGLQLTAKAFEIIQRSEVGRYILTALKILILPEDPLRLTLNEEPSHFL